MSMGTSMTILFQYGYTISVSLYYTVSLYYLSITILSQYHYTISVWLYYTVSLYYISITIR